MESLKELEELIKDCNKCNLCKTRKNIILGIGNKNADIMIIGECPGIDKDNKEELFARKAEKLMDLAFQIVGIKKEKVYITNIVKCRPPLNKDPLPEEVEICMKYLKKQIMLIKPKKIILLGGMVLKNILGEEYSIITNRGKWIEKNNIKYMPIWNPVELVKDENKKIDFVKDLKLIVEN